MSQISFKNGIKIVASWKLKAQELLQSHIGGADEINDAINLSNT